MHEPQDLFKSELVELIPRLRRFARLLTPSSTSADDLLQATLERALSRRHQWQQGTRLDSWLFTILNSIWKNELRSRAIRNGHGFVNVDDLPDTSPQSRNERTILQRQVFNQVSELPEAQRKAILLVYVEDYAYQQAADILDIPVGTLMSRLARARMALAQALNENENQTIRSKGTRS